MDGQTLLDTARPIVARHARRAGLGAADRDDLLQAVALKYLRSFPTAQPRNAAAWFERTTQRAVIDLHRAHGRHPEDALPDHGDPHAAATVIAVLREATSTSLNAIKQRLVDEILALLSPTDREVFVRRYLRGESSAEVAADLGLAVNTIDQRARRARQRLQEALSSRPELLGELAAPHPRGY